MRSSTVAPGTRLSGRYRLEQRLHDVPADVPAPGGAARWEARDELLNRRVVAATLPAGSPVAEPVMAAARRASRLADQRFVSILDAGDDDGHVWVISEWVDAPSLAELVEPGPLPPREAARVAQVVAEALAAAHRAGLAHGRLRPEAVLRAPDGQVKILGLEVDAAAAADSAGSPPDGERLDTAAIGALLYAGLTGRWPLPTPSAVPAAPVVEGQLCSPRQVRAGVPDHLDEVACRALPELVRRRVTPLSSAAEAAAVLEDRRTGDTTEMIALPVDRGADDPDEDTPGPFAAPALPGRTARWGRTVAYVVLALGLCLALWQLVTAANRDPATPAPRGPSTAPTAAANPTPTGRVLPAVAVDDFDPQGNGEEHPDEVAAATDGDLGTAWTTQTYFRNPELGGQKDGVGLLLDLGEARRVAFVTLQLQGRGTTVEIRTGRVRASTADGFPVVARRAEASPLVTLPLPSVEARYVLVWLTKLPLADSATNYRGGIAEITVRGS